MRLHSFRFSNWLGYRADGSDAQFAGGKSNPAAFQTRKPLRLTVWNDPMESSSSTAITILFQSLKFLKLDCT